MRAHNRPMFRTHTRLSIAIALAWCLGLFANCKVILCAANSATACSCPNGGQGTQVCNGSGTGYGLCDCCATVSGCDDCVGSFGEGFADCKFCRASEKCVAVEAACIDAAQSSYACEQPYCGDERCNGSEDAKTCPEDCQSCALRSTCESCLMDDPLRERCWFCTNNGKCVHSLGDCTGSSFYTMNQCDDPYCGDGTCDSGESCSKCEVDCGACPYCGDGTCDSNETCQSCKSDCGACTGLCSSCEKNEDCDSGFCARRICDGLRACYATSNGSCPTVDGYGCPSKTLFDTCTSQTDCTINGTCKKYNSSRCLQYCNSTADCVGPSADVSPLDPFCSGDNLCLLRCSSAATVCPYGSTCRPFADGTYGYCN